MGGLVNAISHRETKPFPNLCFLVSWLLNVELRKPWRQVHFFHYQLSDIRTQGYASAVKLKISWEEWDYYFHFSYLEVLDFVKYVWNVEISSTPATTRPCWHSTTPGPPLTTCMECNHPSLGKFATTYVQLNTSKTLKNCTQKKYFFIRVQMLESFRNRTPFFKRFFL